MIRNMLRVVLTVLCLAAFGTIPERATAQNCGWRTSLQDSAWSFSANPGVSQTRSFLISNIANETIVITLSVTGDAFGVTPHVDTLAAGDTVTVYLTYHPGSGATVNSHQSSKLTIHRVGMDCSEFLALLGTVTGNSSGNDHTAADSLISDPHEFNFGTIKMDSTACRKVVVINKSSKTMTITGWNNCESNQFSISPSFSNNITLAHGDTIVFTICYTPDSAHASASCNLTLHFKVGDSNDDHTRVISFAGSRKSNDNNTGGDHNILWSDPREFSFGSVALGHDSCRTVWLINPDSNSTIIITGATHCDGHNFSFSPSNMQDTLAPGESKQITICYTPDSAHTTSSCSLTINYITLNPTTDGHHLTINFGGSKAGNDNHNTEACLHTEQGSGFRDGVVVGASANRTLRLINPTGASITVSGDSLSCEDHNAFSASNAQFPITIAAHSEANFNYTFTPFAVNGNSKNVYEGCAFFTVDGDSITCSIVRGVLIGYGAHDHVDSMPHPMFPTGDKGILGIEAKGVRPTKTFIFQNNLPVSASITSVAIEQDGQFFEIQSVHPEVLPATIKAGDLFSVTIALVVTDGKLHTAKLKIAADHALQDNQEFEIQGLNTSAASVREGLPQGVKITVSPNPMSTNLTVAASGIRTATVEVYDMLGKQLTSGAMTTTWNWNAIANGTKVAGGSYIVRINGISENNEQFVTSKMVVVQ